MVYDVVPLPTVNVDEECVSEVDTNVISGVARVKSSVLAKPTEKKKKKRA